MSKESRFRVYGALFFTFLGIGFTIKSVDFMRDSFVRAFLAETQIVTVTSVKLVTGRRRSSYLFQYEFIDPQGIKREGLQWTRSAEIHQESPGKNVGLIVYPKNNYESFGLAGWSFETIVKYLAGPALLVPSLCFLIWGLSQLRRQLGG